MTNTEAELECPECGAHLGCLFGCTGDMTVQLRTALRKARAEGAREMRERAAMLHESIGNECDFDRVSPGTPAGTAGKVCGCGSMGTVVEYRDAIRALPIEEPSR